MTDEKVIDFRFGWLLQCVAESSLAANTAVIVKSGAVVSFVSPNTTLGPDFSVEPGAEFTITTNL